MFNLWFFAAVFLALVDWLATALGWQRIRYFTKGATLVALIVWFSLEGGWQAHLAWFGGGLICGLVGDVALQLPKRFFLVGLGAFLLGHLFFVGGFLSSGTYLRPEGALLVIALISICALIFARLFKGMARRPENRGMRPAVMAYASVITLMVISAGVTLANPAWPVTAALCALAGACLFLVSDSLLAFDQFVQKVCQADLMVMITYHLAQFLITTAALLSLALQP
jgi:alkenylglycerophosphocholine hydrolase